MNPEKDLGASNLPGQRGEGGEEIRVQRGMFGANNGGDTSGYGGLVRSVRLPGPASRPYGGWFDEVADELEGALEEQGLLPENAIEKTVVDRDELTFHIEREHLLRVARTLRDDPALRFELCTGVSGVHYPERQGPRAARRLPPALDHPQPADPPGSQRPGQPTRTSRRSSPSIRPTTGTSARPTTSSASSSTATPP